MKSYTVQTGDTLESIAIRFLYRSALAYKIRQVNNLPGNTVYPGQVLKIPKIEQIEQREYADIIIIVDGKELAQTPPITIQSAINTIAPGFSFDFPINEAVSGIFKPFGFEKIDIYYNNYPVLSGYVDSYAPRSEEKTATISGFGKSQILAECNFPPASYPRTFYNSTLEKIIKKLIDPFNIDVTIDDDAKSGASEKFQKAEIPVTENIANFIVELAKQKGLIVYGDNTGGIVLKNEYVDTEKILKLEGTPGVAEYTGSGIFSDYTCLKNANSAGGSQTARNKIKIDEFRSKVFEMRNIQTESLEKNIKREMKADLINSHKLSISLPYVTDINGDLITINKQIYYKNDDLFADDDYIITATTHDFSATEQKVTCDLVPTRFLEGKI